MSVCLSIYLSVCLSIYLSIYPSIHPAILTTSMQHNPLSEAATQPVNKFPIFNEIQRSNTVIQQTMTCPYPKPDESSPHSNPTFLIFPYQLSPLLCPWAQQLSQDILVDVGFLCNKAAVLSTWQKWHPALKWILRKYLERCGLDVSDSGKELVVSSCQHVNEPSGSIKGRGFVI